MKTSHRNAAIAAVGLYATAVSAASCSNVIAPSYNALSVASGWSAQLVANGLTKPRSILFDSAGGLLVVESGKGVSRLVFTDNGGTCLEVSSSTLLINDTTLNHGIALNSDQTVLFASSADNVRGWTYDAKTGAVSGTPITVVDGMSNNDQTTRTLLMSQKRDNFLLVSRGSSQDYDTDALNVNSGLSQIRGFDLSGFYSSPSTRSSAYTYDSAGLRAGWGLLNAVGVAEHPVSGGVYAVDNGVDGATRNGVDIHQNNPGDELNYLGVMSNLTQTSQGTNYGSPNCYAVWDPSSFNNTLSVGEQFSLFDNSTLNDTTCASDYTPPVLTFQAHMAPLDILFSTDGSTAYVSFHGSTDKTNPVGYRVSAISFDNTTGVPTEASDSTTALSDIISNPDLTQCPGNCFRPVGLAWDTTGRLYVTSDRSGEILVLEKSSTTPTATTSGTQVTATGKANAAPRLFSQATAIMSTVVAGSVMALMAAF